MTTEAIDPELDPDEDDLSEVPEPSNEVEWKGEDLLHAAHERNAALMRENDRLTASIAQLLRERNAYRLTINKIHRRKERAGEVIMVKRATAERAQARAERAAAGIPAGEGADEDITLTATPPVEG